MRSPSVPVFNPASQMAAEQDSSTGILRRRTSAWAALGRAAREKLSELGEVTVFTRASCNMDFLALPPSSRTWMTERNESVSARIIPIRNPNRKDSLKTPIGLLLKDPNTSEMKSSADRPRQQSVTADGQVMDRGAEGAAGGYDAI